MRRRAGAVAALALLGAATTAAGPVPLGPCGPIARPHDVVEVPVPALHRLGGIPAARLGLVAFRGGRATPIPFQLDERRGRKLALPEGPEPTLDDKPGLLDADDLLVFMACDAGERAAPEAVTAALGTVRAWREIRLQDPLAHTTGFVYLADAAPPPTTDRSYVDYDAATDLISTARYRVGCTTALPTHLSFVTGAGPGPNLLDGLRLRAEATLRANLAHWKLNEQLGRHALIAWKRGPVRAIRRSRHWVRLGLGIDISAGVAHTYFQARHVYGPGSLKLPFSPGVLFRDIRASAGADCRDLRGWRYHAAAAPPRGFRIDGHMDAAERAFASSGEWFALAQRDQALLFVTRLDENLRRAIPLRLVYRDDAERPDPPEASPGTVPLAGYEGRGVEKLEAGRYRFSLHIYALDGYRRGDEARMLAALDTPLAVAVTAEWPSSDPAAPGDGPADSRRGS
jgi:hypothetical protein